MLVPDNPTSLFKHPMKLRFVPIMLVIAIVGVLGFSKSPTIGWPAAHSRTAVAVDKGDTLTPSFAILTDTVLGIASAYKVQAKGCGISKFIVRLTNQRGAIVVSDTNDIVVCPDSSHMIPIVNGLDTSKAQPSCGVTSDSLLLLTLHPCAVDTLLSPAIFDNKPCVWTIVRDTTIACLYITKT